ncbi:MAG TPA: diacylglycerol kinase family protein [Leptospiraceae bacterium]|jgi:YegS/Rv2252/BmrU family lipid kinase|nr:hypothetical protein [Leptospirales bacterium]HMW58387.1 diacylglycerol kinase family protein [Leptospiraceae bacterium]HMX56056.1 diacylglycerol kinase family protein [Leptospiraceae bacterium]HMZ37499.1 diacylglycerol kinase family protein [Leptospiraceae bacterium]HNJ04112.1 diacylglycerol kinase family protein [Leptospiraceae bacterium]
MKRLVILNPKSRSGRALTVFRALEPDIRARLGQLDVYETTAPLDATARVREALRKRQYDQILIAGGDGTINEAVNGYFDGKKQIDTKIPMGVFNLGTGGDFYKTVQQLSGVYDVAIKENKSKKVDVGRVTIGGEVRHFINIASAGVAGQIMNSLKNSTFQWGSPAYYYHTVKSLILYRPQTVTIRYVSNGKKEEVRVSLLNFFACNGRFNGGGMNWAPNAQLNDGLFDCVIIGGVSKMKLVTQSPKVYAGRISEFPGTVQFRASEVSLISEQTVEGEADGEVYVMNGGGEIRYETLPGCLPLIL